MVEAAGPGRLSTAREPQASKAALARLARLVRDRKFRDTHGLAVVEGPRAVDGALASGATLEAVFARPELVARYSPALLPASRSANADPHAPDGAESPRPAGAGGADEAHPDALRLGEGFAERIGAVYEASPETLDPLADAVNPQGVLAIARFADAEIDVAVAADRVVVLEAIRDPGNAGAIVRSAVAAGFGAVIATEGTTDLWAPKALRGAAGLTFGPAVCRGRPVTDVLEALRSAGHVRVRAAPDGDVAFSELPNAERMTLVVGNEARGPSAEAVAGTDLATAIPMCHPVDSLNVGVAAAVLMYAMRRS